MAEYKLVVTLHRNWLADPNADVPTFVRKGRTNTNVIQVSFVSWSDNQHATIDPANILDKWVATMDGQQVVRLDTSRPEAMATSRFTRAEFPYCQAWSIIDGRNLINATFICDEYPTTEEIEEVEAMVESLGVREVPRKKKWLWF